MAARDQSRGGKPQPLTVWRISKAAHAAFDGAGARLYGGRWSHPGVRVVYASSSLALAALEFFVHVDTDLEPPDLVSTAAVVPADLEIETVEVADLPKRWRAYPAPEALQDLGAAWLERRRTAVLSVPSAVVPEERNFLLDPAHPDFATVRRLPPRRFSFDPRMFR